jgi:cell filamentation protein, protein adenylyltransferase
MDPAGFTSLRAGRVVAVGRGDARFFAFEPKPTPREIELDAELVLVLSEADQELGRLAGLGELLPNPHLLIRPYLRREAVSSTRIEGTQSTLGDVFSAEAQLKLLPENPDLREVLNYVRALELGLVRLRSLPLSNRLLREMHAELMRGVRGQERTPGDFRRSPNWIGGRGPSDAVFVPPDPDRMIVALDDFERYLHEDVPLPLLVRCALIHYQFETIHPFLDGNGRLGRLLIVFYLVERGVLRQPLLYLSSYFEGHREEYVRSLQSVREEGAYEEWIKFFLRAVASQARLATETSEALIRLGRGFRDRLRSIRARGQAIDAAEALIGNPFVSAPSLARDLGLTRQGAQYVIDTLQRAEIVVPSPGETRPMLYLAREVLTLLESDTPAAASVHS